MYDQMIREVMAKRGDVGRYDARHVEAFMRVEHSTLDGLSKQQFASEVVIACKCIEEVGANRSEAIAKSFGL